MENTIFTNIYSTHYSNPFTSHREHPNKKAYPNQKMFIISYNEYAYLVPFVEDEVKIFLKTIIPSRKATKMYIVK